MAEAAPIVLWQLGPCWGMPSGSPFCTKLETWLRMVELPYEARVITGLPVNTIASHVHRARTFLRERVARASAPEASDD